MLDDALSKLKKTTNHHSFQQSFFGTLKEEIFYEQINFQSADDLRACIHNITLLNLRFMDT